MVGGQRVLTSMLMSLVTEPWRTWSMAVPFLESELMASAASVAEAGDLELMRRMMSPLRSPELAAGELGWTSSMRRPGTSAGRLREGLEASSTGRIFMPAT